PPPGGYGTTITMLRDGKPCPRAASAAPAARSAIAAQAIARRRHGSAGRGVGRRRPTVDARAPPADSPADAVLSSNIVASPSCARAARPRAILGGTIIQVRSNWG